MSTKEYSDLVRKITESRIEEYNRLAVFSKIFRDYLLLTDDIDGFRDFVGSKYGYPDNELISEVLADVVCTTCCEECHTKEKDL